MSSNQTNRPALRPKHVREANTSCAVRHASLRPKAHIMCRRHLLPRLHRCFDGGLDEIVGIKGATKISRTGGLGGKSGIARTGGLGRKSGIARTCVLAFLLLAPPFPQDVCHAHAVTDRILPCTPLLLSDVRPRHSLVDQRNVLRVLQNTKILLRYRARSANGLRPNGLRPISR